ncbi:MAG: hypothetical protein R8N24_00955, partial [Alphaproteobacteria bacterium]|nr:hypothetical protein [Alphaproteobacteria bacterium]
MFIVKSYSRICCAPSTIGWGDDNGAAASEYNSDSYAAAPVTETSSYTDYADTPAPVVPDMSAYD